MTTIFHRIDTASQSLVLRIRDGGMAEAIYWDAALPSGEDLDMLSANHEIDLNGGMLDRVAPLSICPEASAPFPGQPGLSLSDENGPIFPRFRFDRAETGDTLALHFTDTDLGLTYTARFTPAGDVITASAELQSNRPLLCHWLAAPVLPAPLLSDEIHDWHGTWLREYQRQVTPWSHGIRLREARMGRSGHEHPPVALIPTRGASKTGGVVHGLQLGWSGGHRFVAEALPDGRRQLQMGKASGTERKGTRFHSGDLVLALSTGGEAGIARAYQRHIRDHVVTWPDPARPRPVHYNCWEAIYFDHSLEKLSEIAERAAKLGAERFVLDDGWFGRRDDDTSSLGDWTIDRRKWPDGLNPLIDKVHALGMSFGLWVEPEMINRDSDLYRAHPDWILGREDQVTGRNQYVLDIARPEVRDYLFDALDSLLGSHKIDYLKWDHNRLLPIADAAQADGIYDLLARLRAAHPAVEIESCASGGGRIDIGILAHTHRVWLSDSNDAIERLRMQHDAALFLPPAVTGSHVGARDSHSSGRNLPIAFRAWVAAQRHMGFEMDPGELTEAEAETLTRVTCWWKDTRDWRMAGDTLPLDSADPAVISEMQIAADGSRFVLFVGRHATSAQSLPLAQRLTGLDPDSRYRLRLLNPEDRPPQSRGHVALEQGEITLSGAALMSRGVNLPLSWPATMWVVEAERL
ncbi:alpha-galactosidase [Paracoccus zhejiangensis]|uniref:Alpha-galactosidase n=1 Tax=Paracoccus zhejiangensis TaxID=1077935 RepID=A0A2H5F4N1_9RHOB|nr:alpha-galactosidase [Paracoccus zhejiangensis]AUH66500.1 alpha-galactosidase [Paracoccus zhejiangensis]